MSEVIRDSRDKDQLSGVCDVFADGDETYLLEWFGLVCAKLKGEKGRRSRCFSKSDDANGPRFMSGRARLLRALAQEHTTRNAPELSCFEC